MRSVYGTTLGLFILLGGCAHHADNRADVMRHCQMLQHGDASVRVRALKWFAQNYVHIGMARADVERVLGVGELSTGGSYWYTETDSDYETDVFVRYVLSHGQEVIQSLRYEEAAKTAPGDVGRE